MEWGSGTPWEGNREQFTKLNTDITKNMVTGYEEKEIRNECKEIPLTDIVPRLTCNVNDITLPIYNASQYSGSLKVNFLTMPSSPTMTSDRPAQK